ncbi:hypothetical protein NE865_05653 [Phthorimaea operculella]|nr:hypothetical protein NE865_05653 [Phthorimaea operculella]
MILCLTLLTVILVYVEAYYRTAFNLIGNTESGLQCRSTPDPDVFGDNLSKDGRRHNFDPSLQRDLLDSLRAQLHRHLYGEKVDIWSMWLGEKELENASQETIKLTGEQGNISPQGEDNNASQYRYQYPDGQNMRAELFNNKSAVHFPPREFIEKGRAMLKVTDDYMQTAINAFAILLDGSIDDIKNLPSDYVLKSARTISMMRITNDKLAMLWTVMKHGRPTSEITYEELEMYRPLFKYVNAREIGRLNLTNTKILNFVGTHADLDRHQVGVIASKYMQLNPRWREVKYLNYMNNLLCGVPMNFMRMLKSPVYLQLSYQVFYHIRACDPLQKSFFLYMMTKTEALGKSYSWSARDVSRLGLLLAEVRGPDLAAINPEAMSGITAQVMREIPAVNLKYLTEVQVSYLATKPHAIYAKKLQSLNEDDSDNTQRVAFNVWSCLCTILLHIVLKQ